MYKSRVVFVFLVFPVALTAAAPGEGTLSEETKTHHRDRSLAQ